MQLAEPESFRTLDDHHGGIRDIHSDLYHGGCYEDVRPARSKGIHVEFLLVIGLLAVDDGSLVGRERESLYELYLNQLKFIRQNQSEQAAVTNTVQKNENSPSVKKTDRQIKNEDAIEALESQLQSSLSRRWKIDPFYLDKTRWKIGIFYIKSPVQLLHADCEEIIAFAERDIFSGVASAAVEVQSKSVGGFGEAFRLSRSAGLDYFAIIKVWNFCLLFNNHLYFFCSERTVVSP